MRGRKRWNEVDAKREGRNDEMTRKERRREEV